MRGKIAKRNSSASAHLQSQEPKGILPVIEDKVFRDKVGAASDSAT